MAIFNKENAKKIKEFLKQMKNKVEIVYFTQEFECNLCQQTHEFLKEFDQFSAKIKLTVLDFEKDAQRAAEMGVEKIPAIVLLDANGQNTGVRFYGLPGGYEINSFLKALVEASGKLTEYEKEIEKAIKAINKDIHIQIMVALTCPHCPAAVSTAHSIALRNPRISADMVDGNVFADLTQKYKVTGVPKIIINEKQELVGNQPVEKFLEEIEKI
jgi:glutaredoxin-like protein